MNRTHRKIIFFVLLVSIAFTGCSWQLRGGKSRYNALRTSVDQHLRSIYFKGASWSIMAVDLRDGRVLLNRNADRSLIPASNLKLLTTACALETLSPDYQIETRVGYTGEIDSTGVLRGDLVVIGAGDPSIETRFGDESALPAASQPPDIMVSWADSLAKRGIRRIEGDITGYSAFYMRDYYGTGWEWNDLKNWYAAEVSPLVYTDNCIEITITPADSVGQYAAIGWSPDLGFAQFYSQVLTTAADEKPSIHFDRGLTNNIISIWGTVPMGSEPIKRWIAVFDAQTWFLTALKDALVRAGIAVDGDINATNSTWIESRDFKPLFITLSPPLAKLIQITNQDSQNLYAESLLRNLGLQAMMHDTNGVYSGSDAFSVGRRVVMDWESRLIGASTGFVMADGCGLSRRNLMSASELIKILVHMNLSKYRRDFVVSLATPGNGTLKYRFFGFPDGVYLHAKSGSLARVRALSGYVATVDGPQIAFAMICNNYLCNPSEVEAAMEDICQLLALYLKSTLK